MKIKIHFTVILCLLFLDLSCKHDKDPSPSDAEKIIGIWKREGVLDGISDGLADTLKFGKDSVEEKYGKYKYEVKEGKIIYYEGIIVASKTPYQFISNDNLKIECLGGPSGSSCYNNLTRLK
jgi:hypothetical protein